MRKRSDSGMPNQTWLSFAIELAFLASLYCASKLIHSKAHIVMVALCGSGSNTTELRFLYSVLVHQIMQTLIAFWYLHVVLTHLDQSANLLAELPPHHKLFMARESPRLQSLIQSVRWHESLVIYAWACSFVNALWEILYDFVGFHSGSYGLGLGIFFALLIALIIVAVLIAKQSPSGDDFYYEDEMFKGNRSWLCTANIMIFWTIDFMTWWAWDEVVVMVDSAARPANFDQAEPISQSPKIIGLNFGIMFALMALICATTVMSARAGTLNLAGWRKLGKVPTPRDLANRKKHVRRRVLPESSDGTGASALKSGWGGGKGKIYVTS